MSTQFALMPSVPAKSFDAFAIDNVAGTSYALLANACLVTWQTSFGTAPAAVNIIIETSLDDSVWSTIATTTNVNGESDSFVTSALFIRASIVSHTNGDTVTVNLVAKTAMLSTGQTLIGNITEGQVAFGSATANTLDGSDDLDWDDTAKSLTIIGAPGSTTLTLPNDVDTLSGSDAGAHFGPPGSDFSGSVDNTGNNMLEVATKASGVAGLLVQSQDTGAFSIESAAGTSATAGSARNVQFLTVAFGTLNPSLLKSIEILIRNAGSGAVVESNGILIRTPLNGGGGSITTCYALKIENQNIGGTNYAIKTGLGLVEFGDTVKATGYKSSDGTAGATAGPFTTINSIQVKNGLVTTLTGS